MPQGPPYLPQTAQLGGLPTVSVDVPISAVLLFIFVCAAATNMTIFQINRRRGHKFVFSGLLFGFCMARITALAMRIAWATHPTNTNVAIAANVFTQAGVLLLFVVNLLFTQRMVRAYQPSFGWRRPVTLAFRTLLFSVIALLVMVITASVHMFFTLSPGARTKDRQVQLFSVTFLAVLAFLPIPLSLLAALWPQRRTPAENFGRGRLSTKLYLLLFTATLLALGACFRAGVAFDVRPASHPAWFHHRACYYVFNFGIELVVVFTYAASRFDRRFHVPNGSSAPGHYAAGAGRGAADSGDDVGDESAWAERARKELSTSDLAHPGPGPDFELGTAGSR
ncbi:hypothetical protein QBC33DRAFT_565790 [Phialemonium atrogriseum]|uniref:Family c-likeg-protein-coupled receptor protein n=1 Tax=Phialemonium atrogriseum TaxID=1093897 RepID=A0AAJ0FL00_9PEZI|nr:uncharacterized protein QBC33DRAFT_565790 [Phialemonium atrogriseum]KAK1771642.1 hypothetical protein QBC33DRAFT_565790 [Phialemonium atrogriseum]